MGNFVIGVVVVSNDKKMSNSTFVFLISYFYSRTSALVLLPSYFYLRTSTFVLLPSYFYLRTSNFRITSLRSVILCGGN
ncbi:hypothetical protein [Salinimicrobium sp. HB62]|uniref:hypothetical protein n=1 Tax=Salinimicrobium sp. HB62 TaxID=3077781 RepID=UPI002D785A1A|nr:hypothetical protein [Salinimicrobium sp. HB62]